MIANARMYAVTPEVEAAWRRLFAQVAEDAGVALDYLAWPAPAPLEPLWTRGDLGCAFMCGFPIALRLADVSPLAAPIPDAEWAQGRAVYRTDLVVRADAPFRTLEDTLGGRLGWTVEHSHSGFNALRRHLLAHRTDARPRLYREVVPNLVSPRGVIDAVLSGAIDVGPLDAYWRLLAAQDRPDLIARLRVVDSTEVAPMPALVANAAAPRESREALRGALVEATARPWFAPLAERLRIRGFEAAEFESYATTLAWDREARERGYPEPA